MHLIYHYNNDEEFEVMYTKSIDKRLNNAHRDTNNDQVHTVIGKLKQMKRWMIFKVQYFSMTVDKSRIVEII